MLDDCLHSTIGVHTPDVVVAAVAMRPDLVVVRGAEDQRRRVEHVHVLVLLALVHALVEALGRASAAAATTAAGRGEERGVHAQHGRAVDGRAVDAHEALDAELVACAARARVEARREQAEVGRQVLHGDGGVVGERRHVAEVVALAAGRASVVQVKDCLSIGALVQPLAQIAELVDDRLEERGRATQHKHVRVVQVDDARADEHEHEGGQEEQPVGSKKQATHEAVPEKKKKKERFVSRCFYSFYSHN